MVFFKKIKNIGSVLDKYENNKMLVIVFIIFWLMFWLVSVYFFIEMCGVCCKILCILLVIVIVIFIIVLSEFINIEVRKIFFGGNDKKFIVLYLMFLLFVIYMINFVKFIFKKVLIIVLDMVMSVCIC